MNWTYTKSIVGIDKEESDDLLTKIFKHQERLELTCRFKWTKNAVAIWNNRSVIHHAIADYFPNRGLGHRRLWIGLQLEEKNHFNYNFSNLRFLFHH